MFSLRRGVAWDCSVGATVHRPRKGERVGANRTRDGDVGARSSGVAGIRVVRTRRGYVPAKLPLDAGRVVIAWISMDPR